MDGYNRVNKTGEQQLEVTVSSDHQQSANSDQPLKSVAPEKYIFYI